MTPIFNTKNTRNILLLFTLFFGLTGRGQNFLWADQIKGTVHDYSDFANGLAIDNNENSYIIGNTESLLFDIDPTISGENIIDNTSINHTFRGTYLIKVDSSGNFLWGQTFGSYKGNDIAYDVKIGTDGNIYALLTLEELNNNLNIIESYIKVIKLSPNGNILSTKIIKQNYGYSNNLYVNSFDLDDQNNIFLTGYFTGNIALDTSNSSLNISTNSLGSYLLKISNSGDFEWVKQFNTIGSEVAIRPDGNINLLLNNNTGYTLFNIDTINNSIIWQKDFINQRQNAFHISNNGIAILGEKNYYDTIDVNPSSGVSNISGENCFIIFLDLNGDFIDVKQFNKPTNGNITFTALTTNSNGDYIFGGTFSDTIDLDPSNNIFNLTSYGYKGEAFYLKLDSNRNFDSAIKLGDENPKLSPYNNCEFLQIKKIKIVNQNHYLMGDFMWTCDFDPSTTTQHTLETVNSSTINRDGFILKLGPCDTSMPNGDINQNFCSSQNATIANLTPNSSSIKWYDSLTSSTKLVNSTSLINGQKYYASRQEGSCLESTDRLEVTVSINQVPKIPIASNPEFCKSDNAKLYEITISGQNIKWYDSLIGGLLLPNTTILIDNITYYATQTVNGCESERTPITVTVNNVATLVATSPQHFCIQQNATLNNIAITTGENIKWYDALTNRNLLVNSTLLQNAISYYASQTINGCESERIPVSIDIQNTLSPTGNANQTFCSDQNPTIANITVNGQDIKWYDAITNGNTLISNASLQNGITYYASQIISNCESERTPIKIQIKEATTADCNNFTDELPFPKFFTPNNDGYNDTWTIDFIYLAPNTGIRIFDRYGKLIKVLNINQVWDGTYNGYNLPSSDYWFVVTRLNGAEFKSHFSLKR